jgi:hypothetical protein
MAPGDKFGRWTVVTPNCFSDQRYNKMSLCQCECGTVRHVKSYSLRKGLSRSCGCLCADRTRQLGNSLKQENPVSRRPEHYAWVNMIHRCTSPNSRVFCHYGGRGISVCGEWMESFDTFLSDVGPRPSKEHSLDRIDVNGNYEPGNVRWATVDEQAKNRRSTHLVTKGNLTKSVAEWCRDLGISPHKAYYRLKRGMTPYEAIFIGYSRRNGSKSVEGIGADSHSQRG